MPIKILVDGIEYDPEKNKFDETVTRIYAWYDRHTRDYRIQKLNKDGFQIGDSIRVGSKEEKDSIVQELEKEINKNL